MTAPLSSANQQMVWIECYCWFYQFLSTNQKNTFKTLLDEFIHKMNFVDVGISITEEMKVAIGGWAVLLVLNHPLGINWYQRIERILIYPGNSVDGKGDLGLLAGGGDYSQVNLAWQNVRDTATKASNDQNVILHEFAHALDHIDRVFDGSPRVMLSTSEKNEWQKTFYSGFIHSKSPKKRKQLWDFFELHLWNKYNPSDPACVNVSELFAVATEKFFECPAKLKKMAPEIYGRLQALYRFDPVVDLPKKKLLNA